MVVTKANITGLIDRLEKQGFVERLRYDSDRRKIIAAITEKGKLFTEQVMEDYKNWTKEILDFLETNEKNSLVHILKTMRQGLMNKMV